MDYLNFFTLAIDASSRDLKRAYAKRLKQTSPETDPEGFQRLRQYYEYAQKAMAEQATVQAVKPVTETVQDNVEEQQFETVQLQSAAIEQACTATDEQMPVEMGSYHKLESVYSLSCVDEIIRSLNNGLEDQALSYLQMMIDEEEIYSLELSEALKIQVLALLLQIPETERWPLNFVRAFSEALDLNALAQTDHDLDQQLNILYKRSTMAANHWTADDFDHHQWVKQAVYDAMTGIRFTLFESGQSAAIEKFNDYLQHDLFKDPLARTYFVNSYLQDIDQYFTGSFPLRLAQALENEFEFSANTESYGEQTQQAYHRYMQRRNGGVQRMDKWDKLQLHGSTNQDLAWGIILDFISPEQVRDKAVSVAQSIRGIFASLEKDDFFYYELGGEERIEAVEIWLDKVDKQTLSVFRSEHTDLSSSLNPLTYIKDIKKIVSQEMLSLIIGLLIACLTLYTFSAFNKGEYVELLYVSLGFASMATGVLMIYYLRCLYISRWDAYRYRELSLVEGLLRRRYAWVFVGSLVAGLAILAHHTYLALIGVVILLLIMAFFIGSSLLFRILLVSMMPMMFLNMGLKLLPLINSVVTSLILSVVIVFYIYWAVDRLDNKKYSLEEKKKQRTITIIVFYIGVIMLGLKLPSMLQ